MEHDPALVLTVGVGLSSVAQAVGTTTATAIAPGVLAIALVVVSLAKQFSDARTRQAAEGSA